MRISLRACSWVLVTTLSLAPFQAIANNGYKDLLTTRSIIRREELNNNRWIEVPGRGSMMFYAQNNPLWSQMRYEEAGSSSRRKFGDGGCAPTSAAIAFVNLLSIEKLGLILPHASEKAGGFGIATNAINPLNTPSGDGIYWFNSAEEYRTYLPLVFGQYAVGNNQRRESWRVKPKKENVRSGGTGIGFVPKLCSIYGLDYEIVVPKGTLNWIEPVKHGATAVALANSTRQPFVNSKGHYVAIVGADSQYLYIMDPQDKLQSDYTATDRKRVLQVLEPGLIRVKQSDFKQLCFSLIYVLTNEDVTASMLAAKRNGN